MVNWLSNPKSKKQLARRSPLAFAILATQGKFKSAPHLRVLDNEMVLADLEGSKRIQTNMPPRHGKSQLGTIWQAAWKICKRPDQRVVIVAHTATYAEELSGKAKDIVERYGEEFFNVQIDKKSSARSKWSIKGQAEGGVVAIGVGGPFAGRGADLLIIDDPVKDAADAKSRLKQENLWDWYQGVSENRIEPRGSIFLTMTRWHPLDLAGRIIRQQQEPIDDPDIEPIPWQIIRFPALADPLLPDCLNRKPGEALWPFRYPRERLLQIKASGGSHYFQCLYQQDPVYRSGGIFKREWFQREGFIQSPRILPTFSVRLRAWDYAATVGDGDWTVGSLLGKQPFALPRFSKIWVLDMARFQESPHKRDERVKALAESDGLDCAIRIEQDPGQAGTSQIDDAKLKLYKWEVEGRLATGDKVTRADALCAACERGDVHFIRAPWNRKAIEELCDFDQGMHDDIVDSLSIGYNEIMGGFIEI